jgi:hypothetical protein
MGQAGQPDARNDRASRRHQPLHERRADIHEAFLSLACSIICLRTLRSSK